jgi:hypothetical protein
MCVVIIGGHDRMAGQYRDVCKEYGCDAKVFTQSKINLECMIGTPDLIVLFTNPVSHGMAKAARKKAAKDGVTLAQSHCGSRKALREILNGHARWR